MSDVGIDDDDASGNRSPHFATRPEGVGARLDDSERVALVRMPRIAMGTGVRPQEIDATEPVKPPIARRHALIRKNPAGIFADAGSRGVDPPPPIQLRGKYQRRIRPGSALECTTD
jgi:hypothetical protein